MPPSDDHLEPINGIRVWAESSGAVMLKAITAFGDPVELNESELEIVIAALQRTLECVRSGTME